MLEDKIMLGTLGLIVLFPLLVIVWGRIIYDWMLVSRNRKARKMLATIIAFIALGYINDFGEEEGDLYIEWSDSASNMTRKEAIIYGKLIKVLNNKPYVIKEIIEICESLYGGE